MLGKFDLFLHFPKQGSHSHGKSWKKVVMESYGKVMENSKNSEFHRNFFKVMKKSWKSVVQVQSCSYCVVINVDLDFIPPCLKSHTAVFRNATKTSWKWIHFYHGKSWKNHGVLFLNLCGNPAKSLQLDIIILIDIFIYIYIYL